MHFITNLIKYCLLPSRDAFYNKPYQIFLEGYLNYYLLGRYRNLNLGLDMNGTHQVLSYADVVNLIGDDIRTIERNADVLLNACKDIDLAVNTVKTKYKEAGHHQGLMANGHSR